jgi:hypothetical protein
VVARPARRPRASPGRRLILRVDRHPRAIQGRRTPGASAPGVGFRDAAEAYRDYTDYRTLRYGQEPSGPQWTHHSATARTLSAADVFATPAWPQQSNTDQQMSFRNR